MIIALDYAGTASVDMVMWLQFVQLAQSRGHDIHIVTMRYPHEHCEDLKLLADATKNPIVFTSRMAKRDYALINLGVEFHVWIDDNPHWIYTNSQ